MNDPSLFYNQDGDTLDTVIDLIGDAVCVSDHNMVFTAANRKFAQFYGFKNPHDIIGKSCFDVYPNFKKSVFFEACNHTVTTGEPASRVGYSANLRKWIVLRSCQITPTRYSMIVHALEDNVGRSGVVALFDDLTSLPNRIAFEQDLANIVKHSEEVSVALVDISHFKQFNETLGFQNGDRCLMEVAARLKLSLAHNERAYRIGNDQFLIMSVNSAQRLGITVDMVRDNLNTPMKFQGIEVMLRFHIGLASIQVSKESSDVLLRKAELAMAQAKNRKQEVVQYQDGHASPYDPTQIKALHDAFEKNEMILHFQPQIDAMDGSIIGTEALVRWQHPDKGILYPGTFLPTIEEAGLSRELDRAILARAFDTLQAWKANGMLLQISVNLSGDSVIDPNTIDVVKQHLERTQINPKYLCLEITEGSLIDDVENSQQVIEGLKKLGVEIALDDFGTGYCSMSYLLRYPSHFLKIDRSFVQDVDKNPTKQVTTTNIINLAHGLGIAVVAEGVETHEEMRLVKHMGCDILQGYYYAKPMSEQDFVAWTADKNISSFASPIR